MAIHRTRVAGRRQICGDLGGKEGVKAGEQSGRAPEVGTSKVVQETGVGCGRRARRLP